MSNGGDLGSDFGTHSLDPQERADAELYMDDPEAGDDEPWTPPERQPRGAESVDIEDETLDQRLAQEEPEEGTAYGNPRADDADDDMVGGDDPDAIPAEEDFVGDPDEVVQGGSGDDSLYDGDEPAEESAMHIVNDDEESFDEEDVNIDGEEDIDYED